VSDAGAPSRRDIWIDLLLYPGHTLPTAAAPVIVAVGLAVHNHVFAPVPVIVALLASWLIHVGGIFVDNHELLVRHPELPEHPELLAALKNGTLTIAGLRWAAFACFAMAIATGPYLLTVAGPTVIALGTLGIVASLGYSLGGPLSMTRLGIADPLFFIMFGSVAVAGAYFVQAASLHASSGLLFVPDAPPADAWVLGLPVGALVTNVLLIDDIRDRAFDARKGWRTGPVRFGLAWTRAEFVGFVVFAYLVPLWFWLGLGFSPWVLLTWLTLPEAGTIARTICTTDRFEALFPVTPRTAKLALDYSVLLAIGVAVATE
jgi:1,4-dihydroxy-2-naphthoate octaprenyltransferase